MFMAILLIMFRLVQLFWVFFLFFLKKIAQMRYFYADTAFIYIKCDYHFFLVHEKGRKLKI